MLEFEIINKGCNNTSYGKNVSVYECFATMDNKNTDKQNHICLCKISVTEDKWTISSWYTKTKYKNKGIGKQTLGYLIKQLRQWYNKPCRIEYIWDGTNEYVYDWMIRHFDAKCMCPLAVQKMNEAADDWSAHMYELDVDKVFEYFDKPSTQTPET